ncbi:MAG TPA: chorismate mutase [Planktothrix sp.]|jgi:chorismate mutase
MKQNQTTNNERPNSKLRRLEKLEAARKRIDEVDAQISALLVERLQLANEIGNVKADLHIQIKDKARELDVLARVATASEDANISDAIKEIYQAIFASSRELQARKGAHVAETLYFPQAAVVRFTKTNQ